MTWRRRAFRTVCVGPSSNDTRSAWAKALALRLSCPLGVLGADFRLAIVLPLNFDMDNIHRRALRLVEYANCHFASEHSAGV